MTGGHAENKEVQIRKCVTFKKRKREMQWFNGMHFWTCERFVAFVKWVYGVHCSPCFETKCIYIEVCESNL